MKDAGDFSKENYAGSNFHFGVREQAMTAITNGIALHGGLRPFAATFFVFSDYTKPIARLSSLMKLPVTYIFTHDSIGVGEDGPTHEPIEHRRRKKTQENLSTSSCVPPTSRKNGYARLAKRSRIPTPWWYTALPT